MPTVKFSDGKTETPFRFRELHENGFAKLQCNCGFTFIAKIDHKEIVTCTYCGLQAMCFFYDEEDQPLLTFPITCRYCDYPFIVSPKALNDTTTCPSCSKEQRVILRAGTRKITRQPKRK